jgi:hypothetical protein
MKFLKFFTTILLLAIVTGCSYHQKKNYRHHEMRTKTLLIKNDWINIEKIELAPHERRRMHFEGPRLIVSLSDYTIQYSEMGKSPFESSWSRGQVHWHEGSAHSIKNIGRSPARFMVITRTGELPWNELSETHKEDGQFDNDWVKVSMVSLSPGQQMPKHKGLIRAVIALSDYDIIYNSNCIKNRQSSIKSESVHLHEADEHMIKNNGVTEARFLIVQFKK